MNLNRDLDSMEWCNNCITINFILDNFVELHQNAPLWEVDEISYKLFIKDIRKIQKRYKVKFIDYDIEQKLIELKCQGDSEAFMRLFYSHLPLVISVARKFQNHGFPLNDLISEGNIGLMEAIQKVENKGIRLTTFASSFVRKRIRQFINKYGTQIHYSLNILTTITKIKNAINIFVLQNGYLPSYEEISTISKIDHSVVADTICYINSEVSIEQLNNYYCHDNKVNDLLNSGNYSLSNYIDEEMFLDSLRYETNSALRKLYDRERDILKMFFGIGCKEMSLEEIGEKFYLTIERVRQIKENAIRRLKGDKSKRLRQFLG